MDIETIQGFISEGSPELQARALQYFEHVKQSNDGWKLCITTLTSRDNISDHVKFFCFQVLEYYIKNRYGQSQIEEHQYIKEFISQWIQLQCTLQVAEKTFLRNKAAQMVCLVFLCDYPTLWPTFFTDLQQTLALGPAPTDFYLRLLLAINCEVADREIPRTHKELDRNTLIKDTMREQCVVDLVDSWYHIITLYQHSHPDVVCLCLEVIGAYVAWVDIALIANDKFVSVLVHFLSLPLLREAACDCVHEIINKGMDPMAKVKLVESFVTVLEQARVLNTTKDEDGDFVSKLSKLMNGMGTSLIACWNKLSKGNEQESLPMVLAAIQSKVPFLLRFLSNEDDDVSQAVCDFAREYIQLLKQQSLCGGYGTTEKPNVEAILYILINKYKYDDSYNFNHQGEDEAMFDEYRKCLKILYDNLALLDKELVLSRTKETIVTTLQRWRNSPFQDVEVAITFLYLLGEAIPASHGNHFCGDGDQITVMSQLLKLLVSCGVSTYGHFAVTLQYFETVARYEKFFLQEPHHIPEVLVAFMDDRGLRNVSPKIRSRTSYLFSRFIKCLKAHIQSFTEDILKRLQDLLVLAPPENGITTNLLSSDDQLYLYEAAAILVISSHFDPQKKQSLLKNLLMPVISKFESLVLRLQTETDKEQQRAVAECLSHAMAVTSRTSKAFSNQQTMKSCGCVQVYLNALQMFLRALEVPCEQVILQSSVRQFLHRMVVCLEEEILPFIPLAAQQLLKDSDVRSIQEFIPLINQIITKFKKEVVPFLQSVFLPLVTAIFSALAVPLDERDQQALRDRQMLQRSYFLFVAAIVTNNVTEVIALQDMQSMEQVVLTIIHGAVDFPDPVAQRTCFTILKKMVDLWGGNDNIVVGFVEFTYKSIVPACFLAPLKSSFDLTDAQTILALSESALCLRAVYDKRGEEFINYLQTQYLPTLNISQQTIQDYCQALQADVKIFKKYIKAFFEQAKS